MDLLLIRHATPVIGQTLSDAERPLSAGGRREAREVGEVLAGAAIVLDRVVSSPLVRAVETAELVAVALGYEGGLHVEPLLVPEGRPGVLLDRVLAPLDGAERVALVGHEPSMGYLLSTMLGRPGLSLSRGTVVRLSWPGPGRIASLVWVVTPQRLAPTASLDRL